MAYGYREFDEFASSSSSSNTSSSPELLRVLREVEENVYHFQKNVNAIESKVEKLNTRNDTPRLKEEILQIVADTAQLVKIANGPIQKLRLKSRELGTSDKIQFERLMTDFSSAGIKFKQLQRLTQNLEKDMLNEARHSRQRSSSEYADSPQPTGKGGSNPFGDEENLIGGDKHSSYDDEAMIQEQMDQTRLVEEREQHMRQLETDIIDINDIFRDLGTMVHEQGDVIDNIEANVEIAGNRVEQGNTQLRKAVRHKRCSRKLTCCIFLIVLIIVLALVIGVLILLGVLKVYTSGK